jgi:translocation and assembly module TamA
MNGSIAGRFIFVSFVFFVDNCLFGFIRKIRVYPRPRVESTFLDYWATMANSAIIRSILLATIAGTLLVIGLAAPVMAAEPVEVAVEGVEGEPLANVRKALEIPAGLVRDGKVDRLWLDHFERQAGAKVHAALEPFGYYSAKVTTRTENVGAERYRLQVKVEPGEPVRLSVVEVAVHGPGSRENALQELLAAFPLHKGDVLLQQKYEEAKGRLRSKAQELGYLDADFSRHEIRIDRDKTTAHIGLVLETGEQYRFDEVRLTGAPAYPDKFLRRYLAFRPGEVFSYTKLGETQLNFTNSERFKEVIVTPEKEEAKEYRVPVLVQLKPVPRRRLRPGIGYGTDTGGRFTLRYHDLNMLERGHEFDANLYISERLQGMTTGYLVPAAVDITSSTGVQLNLQQEDVTTYISRLVSVELDRNQGFGRGRQGTAYIKVQQEEFVIGAVKSDARLVLPGVRFAEDRYDNPTRPHRGYRYALELRGTHQLFGSDTALLQGIAEASSLLPLPWRLSLHTRVRAGLTLFTDPLREIPPSLRFFAGGDQSVRGYAYQSLGPTDATGLVVGGRHLVSGSLELERALFKNWGVSAFYDAGNAFNSYDDVRLFQGVGGGVHYYTPVGALNLYLARQVGVDTPAYRVHFTVGFQF